jgi:DNA polymerase-3 subunit gamma/tau
VDEIVGQLKRIAKDEKIKADEDALSLIARQSAGGMRDAISLLDQLSSTGGKIDLALTQTVLGTATSQTVLDLIASIRDHQPAPAMDAIHSALDAGADPRSLARQIVDYLRGLMLVQMGNADQVEVTKDVKTTMFEHARAFSAQDVLRMMKAFNIAAVDTRGGWQPSLSLELAVAEVLETPADTSVTRQEEKPAKVAADKPPAQETRPDKISTQSAEPRAKSETPGKAAKKDAFLETRAPKPEAAPKRALSETIPEEEVKASNNEAEVIGLTDVVKAWRDIRSLVKPDHPSIEALLNSCKPLDVRGNELYLGFQSIKVRELFDIPERIAVARKAITEVLGVDLTIKCVITNAKGQLPPDVNPDGMVATAIQNGGEIVDVQD